MDYRILNFRTEKVVLPSFLNEISEKKLMLSAGDGISSYKGSPLGISNIESMSKYGFNIFCCIYEDNINSGCHLKKNIEFLNKNSDLKVILCLIDLRNDLECKIFDQLFFNQIDYIESHDYRFFLPEKSVYNILKYNGICKIPFISDDDGTPIRKPTQQIIYSEEFKEIIVYPNDKQDALYKRSILPKEKWNITKIDFNHYECSKKF
jgi:hypothetical protein